MSRSAAQAALAVAQAAYAPAYREIAFSLEYLDGEDSEAIRQRMHEISRSFEELGRLLRRAEGSR